MEGKEYLIHLVEVKLCLVKCVLQQDGETRDPLWLEVVVGLCTLQEEGIRNVAGGEPGQRGRAGPMDHSEKTIRVSYLLL